MEPLIAAELTDGNEKFTVHLTAAEIEDLSSDYTKYQAKITELRTLESETGINNEHSFPSTSSAILENETSLSKWNISNSKLLLQLRLGMEENFISPTCKKVKLWENISQKMKESGYNFTGQECHTKYRNMLQTYKQNKEKRLKTTGEAKITWEYYEMFDAVLGSKSSVVPPPNLLSTSINDESCADISEGMSTDTEKENDKKKKESNKKGEMTLKRYLYLKEQNQTAAAKKSDLRWEEKKQIKLAEIDALNNLAQALLESTKRRKRQTSNSDSD